MDMEKEGRGRVAITWRTGFNVPVDREAILDKGLQFSSFHHGVPYFILCPKHMWAEEADG